MDTFILKLWTLLRPVLAGTPVKDPVHLANVRTIAELCLGAVTIGDKSAGKTSLNWRCLNGCVRLRRPLYSVDTGGDFQVDRLLHVAPPGYPVRRWNVTLKKGRCPDFAAACEDQYGTLNLASKLMPAPSGSRDEFWTGNARSVIVSAIRALNHYCPRGWWLSDLIWLVTRLSLFEAVLQATALGPAGQPVHNPLDDLEKKGVARGDIISTVKSRLLALEVYANLAEHCELDDPFAPLTEGGAVVMERSEDVREAVERVDGFVFDLVASRALSRWGQGEVIFWMDELSSMPKLDFLEKVAKRGRRSGVAFLWTLHTLEDLWERYGKTAAMGVLDGMGIKVFLRSQGVETGRWMGEVMGRVLVKEGVWQPERGTQPGYYSYSVVERHNVLPDLFKTLPAPDPADGLLIKGYCSAPDGRYPFSARCLEDNTYPRGPVPEPAPAEWQKTRRRGELDFRRLHIPITPAIRQLLSEGKV